MGFFQARDLTYISYVSCIGRQTLYHQTTWEAPKFNIVVSHEREREWYWPQNQGTSNFSAMYKRRSQAMMTKLLHLLILQSMCTGFILFLNFFFFFLKKLLYRWELCLQGTRMWSPIGHWRNHCPSLSSDQWYSSLRASLTSRRGDLPWMGSPQLSHTFVVKLWYHGNSCYP